MNKLHYSISAEKVNGSQNFLLLSITPYHTSVLTELHTQEVEGKDSPSSKKMSYMYLKMQYLPIGIGTTHTAKGSVHVRPKIFAFNKRIPQ